MLQDIRDKSQGWFAWVVVGLIALVFTLWGTSSLFSSQPKPVVAEVNGFEITETDLNHFYERVLIQAGPEQAMSLNPQNVKAYGLSALVQQAAIESFANEAGFRISDDKIWQEIAMDPTFQENGQFSQQKFQMLLARNYFTPSEYKDQMKSRYLMLQLQHGLVNTNFTLNNDIKTVFKYLDQTRDFDYVLISNEDFLKSVEIKEEDIKKYYQAHRSEFMTDELVKIDYIELDAEQLKKGFQPSKSDLKRFYEDHLQLFQDSEQRKLAHILITFDKTNDASQQAAQDKINEVQSKLEAGEVFSDLAKTYSDDMGSARQGGELPWITRTDNSLIEAFREKGFELEKVGDVSEPLETSFGYHLIKLVDQVDEKTPTFESIQDEVKEAYLNQKAKEQIFEKADTLVTQAYDHDDSLEPAADKLNLEVQTSEYFSKEGSTEGIAQYPGVVRLAFSMEVLEEGHNSEIHEIEKNHFVVLRAVDHKKPEQMPLDVVAPTIERTLKEKRASELAESQAQALLQAAESDEFNKALNETSYKLKTVKQANRQQTPDIQAEVLAKAFEMSPPEESTTYGMTKTSNGYAVIALKKVKDGTFKDAADTKVSQVRNGFAQNLGQIDFQLYTQEAKEQAEVKYLKEEFKVK